MKKILKNPVFTFVLGLLIMVTISVSVYAINASSITYRDTTVKDTLDILYTKKEGMQYVGGGLMNAENGTTYSTVNSNMTVNNNVATLENGIFSLKRDGRVKVCSSSKSHGHGTSDNNTNARLYHNSTLVYELTWKNEIFRCDEFDVVEDDTIYFQVSSNNLDNMVWTLGTYWIYYTDLED